MGMEDKRVKVDADEEEEDLEDVEDVEPTPHNKRTHTFLLHLEPFRLHLDIHKSNPHNSNRTGRTQTP